MFVPSVAKEITSASVLVDMALLYALCHRMHHQHLPFPQQRHGWVSNIETAELVLFATEELIGSIEQQGDDLRASVFGVVVPPEFETFSGQPYELYSPNGLTPFAVSPITGKDWSTIQSIAILTPYPEPSLTTLLAEAGPETSDDSERPKQSGSRPRLRLGTVALQPTTECNLGCDYCYLPPEDLASRNKMDQSIVSGLAQELEAVAEDSPSSEWTLSLVLHAGEPLMAGLKHLKETHYEPLERLRLAKRIQHDLQTNGTLITAKACELFQRYDVGLGVSIDGPQWANDRRHTPSGKETFTRTMRGIECLTDHELPFSAIGVVSLASIPIIVDRMDEYLQFFNDIGANEVGFSIEEQEGSHNVIVDGTATAKIQQFWDTLYAAWEQSSFRPRIRDFDRVLGYLSSPPVEQWPQPIDLLTTVSFDGNVTVLSPELARQPAPQYNNFVVGKLGEASLGDILTRLLTSRTSMLTEVLAGSLACSNQCDYYEYCGGGQPGNRYFEHGHFGSGAHLTNYCRSSVQEPYVTVTGVRLAAPQAGQQVHVRWGRKTQENKW